MNWFDSVVMISTGWLGLFLAIHYWKRERKLWDYLNHGELRRAEAVSHRFLNDNNIESLVEIKEKTQ